MSETNQIDIKKLEGEIKEEEKYLARLQNNFIQSDRFKTMDQEDGSQYLGETKKKDFKDSLEYNYMNAFKRENNSIFMVDPVWKELEQASQSLILKKRILKNLTRKKRNGDKK